MDGTLAITMEGNAFSVRGREKRREREIYIKRHKKKGYRFDSFLRSEQGVSKVGGSLLQPILCPSNRVRLLSLNINMDSKDEEKKDNRGRNEERGGEDILRPFVCASLSCSNS